VIIGWDLATRLCGWCAGDGRQPPTAGAFILTEREVLAELGTQFRGHVLQIHKQYPADLWAVEAPLMASHDDVWTVQRLMGLHFLLHVLGGALGVPVAAVDQSTLKAEFGGKATKLPGETGPQRRRRHKQLAVEAAEKLGIVLPATEAKGKFDAADAASAWKWGLRKAKNPTWERWDRMVHTGRGALL
jgi:hypothetical protein